MSIPKITKLTLKRIVEGLNDIPNNGFGPEPKKLSPEQKKRLMDMASMFENYGQAVRNEEAVMNSAKCLTELCELAETYALNEAGDVFQRNIVEKDMKELKKRVVEYQKVAKECYARMQQLGVAYQDIGHVLGRYYDLQKPATANPAGKSPKKTIHNEEESDVITFPDGELPPPPPEIPPVTEQGKKKVTGEDVDRVCAWCKKSMGTSPGSGGTTHGICQTCKDEMMKDLPAKPSQTPNKP